ncbi:MAG: hypothetical protein OES24_20380 [Acidimicrobiia bacterium]|nr:hypothetical protein [Acidimicrobiia bacterium]
MPIPPRLTTVALVSATALTAVGLNLTVMQRTADNGGSVTVSAGAAATSGDQPATEQAAPTVGISARSAQAPTGMPAGGAGPALDIAARFTQAPSASAPAAPAVTIAAPGAVDPSTSTQAWSTPVTVAATAAPATAQPPAPGSGPSPAPAPFTSARTAAAPATAPTSVAATQPATTATSATSETAGSSNTRPPATEYVTVEFAGVADVVIAFHDRSTVEFWAAWPEPGWAYMVEDDRPSGVKIKFRPSSGGDEAELSIRPEGGELRVKKEY